MSRSRSYPVAVLVTGLSVLASGCGGATTSSDTRSTPPVTTAAASGRATSSVRYGSSVTVSDSSGFEFGAQAGSPRLVARVPATDLSSASVAPPGQDYIAVPLRLTNLQTDRPAPLDALLSSSPVDGPYFSLNLVIATRSGSGDNCQPVTKTQCVLGVMVISPGGKWLSNPNELGGPSTIPAAHALTATVYSDWPVPANLAPSKIALLFVKPSTSPAAPAKKTTVPLP